MTYEYVCEACGHQWEAEQSIKDKPIRECAACGKSTAKRLISGGTGFLLKGGGWYADLYASPGAKPGPQDKSKESSSKSEGSDAKPAEKTATEAKPAATGSTGTTSSSPTPAPTPSAKAS